MILPNLVPPQGNAIRNINKGKENILCDFSFNKDEIVSDEAIQLLDNGHLNVFSKSFKNPVLDMDEVIKEGICIKNMLHIIVSGIMHELFDLFPASNVGSDDI